MSRKIIGAEHDMGQLSQDYELTLADILVREKLRYSNSQINLDNCQLIFYVYWNETSFTWTTGSRQKTIIFKGEPFSACYKKALASYPEIKSKLQIVTTKFGSKVQERRVGETI